MTDSATIQPSDHALALLEGAVDVHVHAGPDPYTERRMDARQLARAAQTRRMSGIVLKSHEYPTQPIAWALKDDFPALDIFGGIALDHGVGGLNPEALRIALKLGTKVVWMPTFDAVHWRSHRPGRYFSSQEPIQLLDDAGQLLPVIHDILDLIAEHNAVLASGHVSVEEGIPLVTSARERGIECVITHASFWWPIDAQRSIAELGGFLEQCAIVSYHSDADTAVPQVMEQVRAVGPGHTILATDLGQAANPDPPIGFALWIDRFLEEGFTAGEIQTMCRDNPGALLGL
ncbi:MAG: DUF6282 family protein [Chloroflexi bacterium]|nr:DUF6282 family protein [Chloroflexota bacterium]